MIAVGAPGRSRRAQDSPWRHVDLLLVVAAGVIAGIGLLMVYSSTRTPLGQQGIDPRYFLSRQVVFAGVGFGLMLVVSFIDYRHYRDLSPVLYGGALVALLLVLTPLGSEVRGTQAWFELGAFQLQPSEFAKPAIIVALASFASRARGQLRLGGFLGMLGLIGLPVGLIFLQPDVGTVLVFGAIGAGMLVVAGAKGRHLLAVALLAGVGVVGVFQADVLEDYQRARLTAFLDPSDDLQQTAYNQNQSQIAIGNGGLTGSGLFQGTQNNLSYVPEQHTDFIFTVVGEELGFLGASTVLGLFALIAWRVLRAAQLSKDLYGTLVAAGVMSMLLFQIFQNIGMATGIMPITGIPLPLLSYGGSSTLATFIGLGLVLNVHMRRFG